MNETLIFAQVMTVIVMSTAAFVAIGLGTRILWRRGSAVQPGREIRHDEDRQRQLEIAVESIAIEVERISEAQRFMVGLLSDPASQRRAELASPERVGKVNTPH